MADEVADLQFCHECDLGRTNPLWVECPCCGTTYGDHDCDCIDDFLVCEAHLPF